MLYTGQTHAELNAPSRNYDEMWVIMRFPTKKTKIEGAWHPELAPSADLFSLFQQLKTEGKWNSGAFETIYTPAFLRELAARPDAQRSLGYLFDKMQTGDIILLCSCYQESMCHRQIVRKLLEGAYAVATDKPDPYGCFTQYQALTGK